MRWLIVTLLAGCSTLASAGAEREPGTRVGGQSQIVTLRAWDLNTVRGMACAPYGVAVESVGPAQRWTYGRRFAPMTEVAVRCAPHASVNGLPAHYNVECRHDENALRQGWQCHGWEAISVRTPIGDISIEPGPYSHELATRTVQAAVDSSLFRGAVHDALPSGCRLAANWSAQGEEVAELSCASGHRFLFSFWCPQSSCPRLMTASQPGE